MEITFPASLLESNSHNWMIFITFEAVTKLKMLLESVDIRSSILSLGLRRKKKSWLLFAPLIFITSLHDKVTSNIVSHDETIEIMNHVKMMATDSGSRKRSQDSQGFKMCSSVWLVTKAKVRDGFFLVTSV